MIFGKHEQTLFKAYARPIVHMRRQFRVSRFGLVLGAGVSKAFRLPGWPDFIKRIAADPSVDGSDILTRVSNRASLPFLTELLFQHFRRTEAQKVNWQKVRSLEFENRTSAKWLAICAKHLYKNLPRNFSAEVAKHPYLSELIPIVQRTPLTITYNFDDFLERSLSERKDPKDKTRGFETVTNPWLQFKREKGVVYHPNGVIKSVLMELPVDKFIFAESSFARQAVGGGDTSFMLHHFCKTTCLVIGTSLQDENLRSALAQSAEINPGNFHYCVHFLRRPSDIKQIDAEAIRRAHYNVFNLITLFLTEKEIAALASLIDPEQVDENAFVDLARQVQAPATYRFYLTGAIGVGKSTAARQLQNLTVFDEWLDPRPKVLGKPWDTLSRTERVRADRWIAKQFRLKNDALRHEQIGIFIIDRPPLDPLAFTDPRKRRAKAKLLYNAICEKGQWSVIDGVVVILRGEPNELAVRLIATGRDDYTSDRLRRMEQDLRAVYKGKGIYAIDTRGMSVSQVTKKIAEVIFFEPYRECQLNRRLKRYR